MTGPVYGARSTLVEFGQFDAVAAAAAAVAQKKINGNDEAVERTCDARGYSPRRA